MERIIRDKERKLQWNDRTIGTMRRIMKSNSNPVRYGIGVGALLSQDPGWERNKKYLLNIWKKDGSYKEKEAKKLLKYIYNGYELCRQASQIDSLHTLAKKKHLY